LAVPKKIVIFAPSLS